MGCKVHMTESTKLLVVTVLLGNSECVFSLIFFFFQEHKNLVCISTSSILLWGLSDTRHKLWLWMAFWWPLCSCGTDTQTHKASCSSIVVHKCKRTHAHLNQHDIKLVWTSELIHAGLRDLWFDYYGELPAVFALESCTRDTWLLATHSVWHTCWLKQKIKHTHNTFPSFHMLLQSFERSHSWEGTHSDCVSDLAMLTSDCRDKRASRSLGGDTRGRK